MRGSERVYGNNLCALRAPAAGEMTERRVSYDLDGAYFDDPPECVTVLGPSQAVPTSVSEVIEGALARQLFAKVPRVIGRAERRRVVRDHALLLEDPGDRIEFVRQTSCRTFAEWTLLEATSTFAVVWSQQRLGLEVRLVRAGEERPLWQAAHTASRSDGGVPLSLIGAPVPPFAPPALTRTRTCCRRWSTTPCAASSPPCRRRCES